MNKDKYVFAQIVEYLDYFKFRRMVMKHHGDAYVKHFTCWHQLLTLMFGQLSGRESLRDLTTVLDAHKSKCTISASAPAPPRGTRFRSPTRTGTTMSLKSTPSS